MLDNIKVWFYGTRTVKIKNKKGSKKNKGAVVTRKEFFRLPEENLKDAKGFHLFVRKSKRAKWIRATEEIETFPSGIRSQASKIDYISAVAVIALEAFFPPKKISVQYVPEAPVKLPKEKEPKVGYYIADEEEVEEFIQETKPKVVLPPVPEEPKISLTKKHFSELMSRIVVDEYDAMNIEWNNERVDRIINKLWKNYSHAPHLLTSELFRRNIVIQEIKEYRLEELQEIQKSSLLEFQKKLSELDVTLDPDVVEGKTRVQLKEILNARGMKSDKDFTVKKTDEEGNEFLADRQTLFTQIVTEYEEFIQVNADDIKDNQEMLNLAISKVRDDVRKLFTEAIDKGIFTLSMESEYAIRLIMPLVDSRGELPKTYKSQDNKSSSGYGYSTTRRVVASIDDLDDLIDSMFTELPKAVARYINVNAAGGIGFTGFTIERLLK